MRKPLFLSIRAADPRSQMVSQTPTDNERRLTADDFAVGELGGFGDGINLPPLRRSYDEINSSLGRTLSSMGSISEQLDHAIGRIDHLLSENRMNRLPSVSLSSNFTVTRAEEGVTSPRPLRSRLQRMPSLENLRSIDCEIKARELAQCFPGGLRALHEYRESGPPDGDYFIITEDMPDR
jgi:hypothetical protein